MEEMIFKGLKLDKFQVDAVHAIENNHSVMVSAATGCGKTLVADYVIDKAIKENKKVIYTAPIKALSNQKYKDFRNDYGEDRVGILTGDVSINPDAQIIVMTTEIYRNMLITKDHEFLDLSYVVFDEIHFINDIERGVVWEESIIFSPAHIRFICLSATIPNAKEFAEWIEKIKKHKVEIVKNQKRVVPLEHNVYAVHHGIITMPEAKEVIAHNKKYLYGAKKKEARQQERKDIAYAHRKIVKELNQMNGLPAIYFVFSRARCEDKAKDLARKTDFLNADEKHDVFSYFNNNITEEVKDLHSVRTVKKLLTKGIGVHHAGLLPILKEIVEHLFSKGLVKVLFATETFAVGINMPAKSVVFNSVEKYDGINFRHLNSKEYFQLAGRAGRRGLDKFGRVISVIETHYTDMDKLIKVSTKDKDPIKSQFKLSVNSVLNMMKNHSDDEIKEILKRNFYYYRQEKRGRKTYFQREFKNIVKELKKYGYIVNESVTEKGDFASNIYASEIPLTELFSGELWKQFSKKEILIMIASIIHESRRGESFDKKGITPTFNVLMEVVKQNHVLHDNFNKVNLKKMIKFVSAWYDGCSFEELLLMCNSLEGDVIRKFRQIIDYCQQIRRATKDTELDEFLTDAMNKIDRDIVKVEF